MSTEKLTCSLVFEGDTEKTIIRLALEDYPRKTGGLLVGHYTADQTCACVTEILPPPPDSRRTEQEFLRGTKGLKKIFRDRWDAPRRTFYLGEWHSRPCHPGPVEKLNVEPSDVDIASMIELADDKATACPQPMLVIVGIWATEDRKMKMTNMGAYGFDRGSTNFVRLKGVEVN